jgi:hypothetical protein
MNDNARPHPVPTPAPQVHRVLCQHRTDPVVPGSLAQQGPQPSPPRCGRGPANDGPAVTAAPTCSARSASRCELSRAALFHWYASKK